jgi:hypothetical protein
MGRRPTIVISSAQVAVDLLEKRSNIYSSRPRFVVMGEMYLGNDSTLVMPYGEKWRKHRKLLHSGLMQKAAHSYRPIQELESQRLAWDFVNKPQQFLDAIERYTASVTLMLAFGRRVDSLGDALVTGVVERNRFMASINVYVPTLTALLTLKSRTLPRRVFPGPQIRSLGVGPMESRSAPKSRRRFQIILGSMSNRKEEDGRWRGTKLLLATYLERPR